MPEITPLLCKTCGGKLLRSIESDDYHCSNCGTEYLVERSKAHGSELKQVLPLSAKKQENKKDLGTTLLKLLEIIPDADKLSILLEPANLLKLLLLYGWKAEDIKQQLESGRVPGDLLIELLVIEPNPEVFLEKLGRPKG